MSQNNTNVIYITDQFQFSELSSKNQEIKVRKRNLPHWEMAGAIYFVTFRLANSIPISVINKLREENELRIKNEIQRPGKMSQSRLNQLKLEMVMKLDDYLDKNIRIRFLSDPRIARIIQEALLHFAVFYMLDINDVSTKPNIKIFQLEECQKNLIPRYVLFRWAIMPNHVHLQIQPLVNPQTGKYFDLGKILHSIKSYTAHEANKMLNREGKFWHHESYDHILRDRKEFYRIWKYIDHNPVKAGLCKSIKDWEWSSEYFIIHL